MKTQYQWHLVEILPSGDDQTKEAYDTYEEAREALLNISLNNYFIIMVKTTYNENDAVLNCDDIEETKETK